jgi:signal transduction histidine kinase/CheY-like chemotaxis protein
MLLLPFSSPSDDIKPDFQDIYTFNIRQSSDKRVDASQYLKFFEDTTNALGFDEAQARVKEFKSIKNAEFNHNFTYWSVLKLRNDSNEGQSFVMMLGYNSIAEVYEIDNNGNVTIKKSGYLMPIPDRDMIHDGDAKVRLSLNIGEEKTLWIKTKQLDHFSPFVVLSLIPYDTWDQTTDRKDLFEGIFTGILLVLAVLSLVFYSYTKEKFFLYYGIYACLHALYFFSFYGYINIYFFPQSPILTQPLWVLQILTFAMYFAFTRNFLKVKDSMPGWYSFFKILTIILVFLFILDSLFLLKTSNLKDGIKFKNVITLICSLIGITFIFSFLRTKKDQAYFLASASTFLLCTLILVSFNYLFYTQVTYNAILVQVGILIEMIVLALAIGYEVKSQLVESRITQDSLILQFQENEKLQIGITQDLEENVAERTHKINIQKRELEQAWNQSENATMAKSEFLSVMSHEIRTPLNAIISLTHLMEMENENPDNQEYIDALKFSGESLHSLINDILDYSKIEAGKLELESVDFSIVDLMNKINGSFKFKGESKGIKINLSIGEYTPERLLGDPTRLTQILNNLISNAIKFTVEGSVNLSTYLVGIKDDTATIGFKVADTGIGIPKDKLGDIFENFEQASRETTRKYGGTGLGLAITKKLIDLHSSKINIESTEGQGSVFSFEIDFKLDKDFEVFETVGLQKEKQNLDKAKILIVDDNDMNRLVLKRLFNKWNGEWSEAVSGKEACELANQYKFDLILMDIEMDELDGFETAALIKSKSELNGNTEIIAMSARGDVEAKSKAQDSSMSDFIRKPFVPQVLFNKISFVLNSSNDKEN